MLTPYSLKLGYGLRDQSIGYAWVTDEYRRDLCVALSREQFRMQKEARANTCLTPWGGVISNGFLRGSWTVPHGVILYDSRDAVKCQHVAKANDQIAV